jgi:hypothetical protein
LSWKGHLSVAGPPGCLRPDETGFLGDGSSALNAGLNAPFEQTVDKNSASKLHLPDNFFSQLMNNEVHVAAATGGID